MSLLEAAQKIARSKPPAHREPYGPWEGSMRSCSAEMVPPEYMAESDSDTPSRNFLYRPLRGHPTLRGTWKRRKGQTQKFDTFGSSVGLLAAKWGAKCRQFEEFKSESVSDDIPTLISKVTKETLTDSANLDDGFFGSYWIRDQVQNSNYTLMSDYSSTTYPVPGTVASYKVPVIWYESGDGGFTRGTSEFARRFYGSGSRGFLQVGNWQYDPSLRGTPWRWRRTYGGGNSSNQTGRPINSAGTLNWLKGNGSSSNLHEAVDDTSADLSPGTTEYLTLSQADNKSLILGMTASLTNPGTLTAVLVIDARATGSAPTSKRFTVTIDADAGATTLYTELVGGDAGNVIPALTASYATYTKNITFTPTPGLPASWGTLRVGLAPGSGGGAADGDFEVSRVELTLTGTTATLNNRLMPAGPLPPTHSGSLAANTQIASDANYVYPDADNTDGAWTDQSGGTSLFAAIDDGATVDDATYIKATTATTCKIGLGNFAVLPASNDAVTVRYRPRRFNTSAAAPSMTVSLLQGSTVIASEVQGSMTTAFVDAGFNLSSAQISAITDWTDLFIQFAITSIGLDEVDVSWAALQFVPASTVATEGGWKGSDKFYYGCAYEFEDGAIWMPTIPRGANTLLTSGWNLFTVDAGNPTSNWLKIIWSNLPYPMYGIRRLWLLRSTKIDSATESDLVLNPHDLRVVAKVDAGVTTYEDFFADDDSLQLPEINELFINEDHLMMPRARYIFGGDSRVCVSYGGQAPEAIELAPISHTSTTAWDLNVADTNVAAYGASHAMYMRLAMDTSSVLTLTLNHSDGTTLQTTSLALATYDTLQKVVDQINTTVAGGTDGRMWRAQLCPGANPDAPSSSLAPHHRAIASCIINNATHAITKAAGGLSKVAVGTLIAETDGTSTGAYVTEIVSDTELTYTGTLTTDAVGKTLYFYYDFGDTPTSGTANKSYVRVIANSRPEFLYFTKTYLDTQGLEKSTIWNTVASPGTLKSAANSFSVREANRHTPPLGAGISMGGVAIDNGFLAPFEHKRAAIRNVRDSGTGSDEDYKLVITNESSGCCAWQSITAANRVAFLASPEGILACDLYDEVLISKAIWAHPDSDSTLGVGDFDIELPLCVASTGQDTDNAYLIARAIGGTLWVNYRKVSTTHPDRELQYDFSASDAPEGGIPSVMRGPGRPWGWSVPLVRSVTAICSGRRADGSHLYGWNDANAGSTGDGRVDEIEVTDQDNLVDIAANITTPWFRIGKRLLAAQEIIAEHRSPTGSTGNLDFHRSFADETYERDLSTSNSTVAPSRDVIMLTLPARAQTDACFIGFRQATGGARELRSLELKVQGPLGFK